jgi:hypothetical protein
VGLVGIVLMGSLIAWVSSISVSRLSTFTPIPDDRLALPTPARTPWIDVAGLATASAMAGETFVQATASAHALQATPAGQLTIRVVAEGPIRVTIVADGVVVFSGWLDTGQITDWYTASLFAVTTSDGSLTLFENTATGQQFYMGYGSNETYYLGG